MKTVATPSVLFFASWLLACGGGTALLLGLSACDSKAPGSTPPVCNTLVDDGPNVTAVEVAAAAPSAVGGTIADGTYMLTALTLYTGVGGPTGDNLGLVASEVQTISGKTVQQVGKINGEEENDTTTIAKVDETGTFWTVDTCPGQGTGVHNYTATATDLRLYNDEGGERILEQVYTLRATDAGAAMAADADAAIATDAGSAMATDADAATATDADGAMATNADGAIGTDAGPPPDHYAVWGFAQQGEVWIGDSTGTMNHYDSSGVQAFSTGTTASVRSIWGAVPTDVWAAAQTGMLHWDGAQLTFVSVPTNGSFVDAVYGSAPNDVWAVGQGGVAVHWDGQAWTSHPTGLDASVNLTGVFVKSPTEAYAVGGSGLVNPAIIAWNGSIWSQIQTTGVKSTLTSVWGTASNNLYIGTTSGMWLYEGGDIWTLEPVSQPINQVWGAAAYDAWAVGGATGSGAALHYDGAQWSVLDTGEPGVLRGVWTGGTGGGKVWIVGDNGVVVRR